MVIFIQKCHKGNTSANLWHLCLEMTSLIVESFSCWDIIAWRCSRGFLWSSSSGWKCKNWDLPELLKKYFGVLFDSTPGSSGGDGSWLTSHHQEPSGLQTNGQTWKTAALWTVTSAFPPTQHDVFKKWKTKWEERTWEAGSEVLHQSLLVDRLVGGIHSGDGQAQDFP